MRDRIERLEREVGTGPRPFEHVTDDELQAALGRVRKGEPSGITILPPGVPTGLEDLTDEEVSARLGAAKASLVPGRQYGMEG